MRRCTLFGLLLSLLAHAGIGWWALNAGEIESPPSPAPLIIDLASVSVARPLPAPTAKKTPPTPPPPEVAPPVKTQPEPPPKVQKPKPLARKVLPRKVKKKPRKKPRKRHVKALPAPRTSTPRPDDSLRDLQRMIASRARPSQTPAASVARPSAASIQDIRASYKAALTAELRKRRFYPKRALRRGREGTVQLGFDILADGRLENIRLVKSSGVKALDNAALKVLRSIGRFKPLPKALGLRRWPLQVPMEYRLSH